MPGRRPQVKTSAQRKVAGRRGRQTASPPAFANRSLPMLRTSERGSLKSCEFRWYIEFVEKRKPVVSAPALRMGTLLHQALAGYYIPGKKRGVHPAEGFLRAYKEEQARVKQAFGARVASEIDGDEKWINAAELGPAMMENYVEEYGADERWEVLVTEHPFEVVVMKDDGVTPWFLYVGVLDGVWRDLGSQRGDIWIPDHKSTKGIGGTAKYPAVPRHLRIDDQAGAYWSWGVDYLYERNLLKRGQPLHGMLYNYLAKKMPDDRPYRIENNVRVYLNKDGTVSKKQPTPHFARVQIHRDEYDRNMQKHRSKSDYVRIEQLLSSQLSVLKTTGPFTCGMCWALDICELHETGNDFGSMMRDTTATWDPYAEHEIYAGEQETQ